MKTMCSPGFPSLQSGCLAEGTQCLHPNCRSEATFGSSFAIGGVWLENWQAAFFLRSTMNRDL